VHFVDAEASGRFASNYLPM
jgi:hypothetical protein